jgi:hypothetical protein
MFKNLTAGEGINRITAGDKNLEATIYRFVR